ncbi:MAG: hypothetical protein K9J12_09355 [Melioribacteraceae bacterium]|nr:hypothetical protein [Melioribacteraceae bacterium]MCF8266281.1 hypothetical protein [Melioribacteraceae bacterium]
MSAADDRIKIFGIGLNKTGTTTLSECGKILGLRCTGVNRRLLKDYVLSNNFDRINQKVSEFDLFEDWPWPLIYKEIDKLYPGSKFILTVRKSEEAWLKSLKKHSLKTDPSLHCRKLAYGFSYPHRHKTEHLNFYRKHNTDVRNYFRNRKNDFIELCWENGDGFAELCDFLGFEIPSVPFPHANKGESTKVSNKIMLKNRFFSLFKG